VEKVAESSGVQFTTSLENINGLVGHDLEINVYRIVQEALNNIVKHSGATEASVRTERKQRGVVVTIQDNGKGISPAGVRITPGGSGMSYMKERARILGGHLDVLPRDGAGTVVQLTIPVNN
jgi:signal transduction histidine kinase